MKCMAMQITIPVVLLTASVSAAWVPPLGIPAPEFGIEQSHTMYAGRTFEAGGFTYRDAGNGPYSHYVDNSRADATDSNNPRGTSETPRRTVPKNLPAGSVVEIHPGDYELSLVNLAGTRDHPIFIRGVDSVSRFRVTALSGGSYNVQYSHYVVIEHAEFFDTRIQIGEATSHICFRHCEIDGNDRVPGVYLWTHKATYDDGEWKEHIVFYDNEVHDCGEYPASEESVCAFMIDDGTRNVWIVDNHIHHNGEDGIQIIDRYWIDGLGPNADRIFMGRNRMHHDIENAIDVKGATNIVISENEMCGYDVLVPASNGDAVRINDEGYQDNIWVLGNRIYDCKYAIGPYNAEFPPYVVGNVIYDCESAVALGGAGEVVGNTVYNCETGIDADGTDNVANNILAVISGRPIIGGGNVYNNLFWNNGRTVSCSECVDADPLFADTASRDFRLREGSPARDAASATIIERLCNTYMESFGVDIRRDLDGNGRPDGSGWDIGAYEYSQSATATWKPEPGGCQRGGPERRMMVLGTRCALPREVQTSGVPRLLYNCLGRAMTAGCDFTHGKVSLHPDGLYVAR